MDPFVRKCTILKVIDGDTLEVEIDVGFNMKSIHRLRLLHVNTPEKKGATKVAGDAATAFTKAWIDERKGKTFYIRTQKSDVFGRWLAELMTEEGDCLNNELLKTGHAVPFEG